MFLTLLVVTFAASIISCSVIVRLFRGPITRILDRIVSDELSAAWRRYMAFAIYVVGVSGGVRIWELEKYITARTDEGVPVTLTGERWVLELYRTVIDTLQACAWLLLVFFVVTLIAYVVVRGFELRRERAGRGPDEPRP
jgi:hypothetical protein